MKEIAGIFLLLLLLSICSFSQQPTPPPIENDDVVKISTVLIQIDATVTDSDGNPVTDLRRDEIEIYENGVKQEITNFSFVSPKPQEYAESKAATTEVPVPLPPTRLAPNQIRRTIALVVDDLTLSFESTYQVRQALKYFVENEMQDGDLVAIIRTAGGVGALQQFTADKRQLDAAIEKVRWSFIPNSRIAAFSPMESQLPGSQKDEEENEGRSTSEIDEEGFREDIFSTGTLGAVEFVIRGMRELPGRKSVMLMSDGFALNRRNKQGFIESTRVLDAMTRLIDQANRSSVVIYTMDARGLQTDGIYASDDLRGRSIAQIRRTLNDRRNERFDTQEGLNYLAKETGGIPIRNNNDLKAGIRRMLDDQSYYLIGYQPDGDVFDPQKRKFNDLEVKVTRKDLNVRYRSGFFGISDEQIKKPSSELTEVQQIYRALTSPFAVNELNLNLNSIFKGDAERNLSINSMVYLNLRDLEFTSEPDGTKKAEFDLLAMNFGDNGIAVDSISKTFMLVFKPEDLAKLLDEGIVYSFNFPIKKAGAYQMRIAVRDHGSQKVGSASQFIEIPNLRNKRIRLSGMIVDNLSYLEWDGALDSGNIKTPTPAETTAKTLTATADTAVRKFKRGSVLYYTLEAYNAASKAGATPQLEYQNRLFRNGKLLYEGEKTPVHINPQTNFKVVPISGAINLGTSLEAGDYALQIVITDKLAKKKRQITSQYVQFEIVE